MNAKKAAAMIAIKADPRGLDRDLASAKKTLRGFGADIKKIGGKMWGGGAGALGKIGAGLGIQASGAITDGIASAIDFERSLVRFQVAAKKTDAEMTNMRDSIREVSRATAVSSDDILAGVQSYIDLTGDVAGATSAMSSFARIAQASGAKVSDVATATAALRTAMKLDPSQVEAVFSGLITQGEKGAVSLKDFAGELATLAPQFATFAGGTGADGIRDMGAAFQVIRNGAGSASQAATQFEALMGELVASHKKLGAIGVRVFQKDGKSLRSFADIAEDLAKNSKLDSVATLQDVFGRKESQQAVRSIRDQIGAMRELRVAGENTTAVQQNLNTVLGSASGKLDVAMNSLKLSIAETFTPGRIEAFAAALENVAKVFGTIVDAAEALFGHAAGDSGYTAWQEKQLDKFASSLTDVEKEFFTANIGPGGALEGTGQGTVTEAALSGGVMSGTIPQSLAEKIRAHQKTLRENPTRVAMTEAGATRRFVEAGQQAPGAAVASAGLDSMKALADQIASAIKGLQLVVKMDGNAVGKSTENSTRNRGAW